MFSKPSSIITAFTMLIASQVIGQQSQKLWVEKLEDSSANFYEVQKTFYSNWENKTAEKGQGFNQFKRFEYYAEQRIFPTGDLAQLSWNFREYEKYKKSNTNSAKSNHVWKPKGPVGTPGGGGGAGRLTFIRFHPTNTNIIWSGTPNGGLWKTIDGGQSWSNTNDYLSVIGCSDLLIDPNNADVMYLATGDNDHYSSYSVGALKSIDGGMTWNPTGLSFAKSSQIRIYKMEMHPTDPNTIIAATTSGIRRTMDGGLTWSTPSTGSYRDIEVVESTPNIWYAVTTSTFKKSTDSGVNWSNISSGIPTSGISRIAIGISPVADSLVYLLIAKSDYSVYGVYASTNFGSSFIQKTGSSVNMLGSNESGTSTGGQAWYDLAFAVNPLNANELWMGGINLWSSVNGGLTWNVKSHWYGAGGNPYVHADIHEIKYIPGTLNILIANDGGMFKTLNAGLSYSDISYDMNISQQYRISQASTTPQLMLAGHQDNGTNRMTSGNNWSRVFGGDGMDCLIDWQNNNRMYAAYQYGNHQRSENGGSSFTSIFSGLAQGLWVSPIHQHPVNSSTIYVGGRPNLIVSYDKGSSYTELSTGFTGDIVEFAISSSNPDVIYVLQGSGSSSKILKTTDAGLTFTNLSGNLPTNSTKTNLAVDPSNSDFVWVTYSGYNASNKVWSTSNGGSSWTNISSGLPNVPCNVLFVQEATDQNIYLGNDLGVFYRDSIDNVWLAFGDSLPVVTVMDIEFFKGDNRLIVGTYGRGTWEVSSANPSVYPPVANFTQSQAVICENLNIVFSNSSTNTPTTYQWTFPGGIPASSTDENPIVNYATAGQYDVEMTVTNSAGTNTKNLFNAVNVQNCVGVTEDQIISLQIFPNPALDFVTIRSQEKIQNAILRDLSGRQVATKLTQLSATEWTLSWAKLSKGMYNIELSTEQGVVLSKVEVLR